MGRKVFISVLGTGFYSECRYVNADFISSETRFIQQASLESAHAENWKPTDVAYVLLTEGAQKNNWNTLEEGRRNLRTGQLEPYTGLKEVLQEMNLPITIKGIEIPEGKNEEEMWCIFSVIFNLLEKEDELYIDLTHSFRYLPMLLLTLTNYAKFLKQINVNTIAYGNYEARNAETNEAPIIDLLPLHALQEWTFATANFLENGYIEGLNNLCKRALAPIFRDEKRRLNTPSAKILKEYMNALQEAINDLKNCRGVNILNGNNIAKAIEWGEKLDEVIIPVMKPVIDKIKASFHFVLSETIMNGYRAAKWCYDNQLYQQALTILHENMVSHICEEMNWDKTDKDKRICISEAYRICHTQLPEEKWKTKMEYVPIIKNILEVQLLSVLASSYFVTTNLRNDFNHSGMRENPTQTSKISTQINERIVKIYTLFNL